MNTVSAQELSNSVLLKRKPYLLFYLLSGLYIALVTLFLSDYNQISFFEGETGAKLTINESIFFFVSVLLFAFILLYLGHRYFKAKINFAVLIASSLFSLIGIIAVLIFPYKSEFLYGYTYLLSAEKRIIFSLMSLVHGLSLYLLIGLFPRCYRTSKAIFGFYFYAVIYALIVFIASFFLNGESYLSFFKGEGSQGLIYSFIGNDNGYSRVLLLGAISSALLFIYQKKWWWLVIYFALAIGIIPSECRASFLCIIFFSLGLAVLGLSKILKKRKMLAIILFVLLIGFIVLAILLGVLSLYPAFMQNIYNLAIRNVFTNLKNEFVSRVALWDEVFKILFSNPTQCRYLFGVNDNNFVTFFIYMLDYARFGSAHNGFIEALVGEGFYHLLIEILMHVSLLYFLFCRFKAKEKGIAVTFFLFEIVLLLLMQVESLGFTLKINTSFYGDYLFLLWLPNYIFYLQKKENIDPIKELDVQKDSKTDFYFKSYIPLIYFVISVLMIGVGSALTSFGFAHLDSGLSYLISGPLISGSGTLLFIYSQGKIEKRSLFVSLSIFVLSFFLSLMIGLSSFSNTNLSSLLFGLTASLLTFISSIILMKAKYLNSFIPLFDELEELWDLNLYQRFLNKEQR